MNEQSLPSRTVSQSVRTIQTGDLNKEVCHAHVALANQYRLCVWTDSGFVAVAMPATRKFQRSNLNSRTDQRWIALLPRSGSGIFTVQVQDKTMGCFATQEATELFTVTKLHKAVTRC